MEVIIGLGFLGLVVWYIYNKVGKEADLNEDSKFDSKDAEIAVDMAVNAVGGMATSAAVSVAQAVETKVEEVDIKVETVEVKVEEVTAKVEEVIKIVEAKVEETVAIVEEVVETVEPVVEEVIEEVVQKAKKGRKSKAK